MRNYNVPGPQWGQTKENEWGTWFLDSNLEVRFVGGKYKIWSKGIKYDFDELEAAQKFAESGHVSRFGGSLVEDNVSTENNTIQSASNNTEMTVNEIKRRVEEIKTIAGDDERAHYLEDDLRGDVLLAISQNKCADPVTCALEALKSSEIRFHRWCA